MFAFEFLLFAVLQQQQQQITFKLGSAVLTSNYTFKAMFKKYLLMCSYGLYYCSYSVNSVYDRWYDAVLILFSCKTFFVFILLFSFFQVWFKNRRAKFRRSRESIGRNFDHNKFYGREKPLAEDIVRSFKTGSGGYPHPYQVTPSNYSLWKYPVAEHSPTYSGSPILDDTLYRQSNPYTSVPSYEYSSYSAPRQPSYFSQQSYYSQTPVSHEYLSNTCTPSSSTNTISSLSFSQENKTDLTLPTFQWSGGSGYMGANM